MNRINQFIISTTNTLEGYTINEYLGTVSAHVVAGTGFFSDFAAGFSDIFGGRSQAYQKQLQHIQTQVLKVLEENAKRIGADAVVGLKIDQDEISGKGKQMFMITAYGTAIKVERNTTALEANNTTVGVIGFEELHSHYKIKRILDRIRNNNFKYENDEVDLLIANQIAEVASYFLEDISGLIKSNTNPNLFEAKRNQIKRYFLGLEAKLAQNYLYDYFAKDKALLNFIDEIITEGNLVDFNKIIELLDNKDFVIQRRAALLLPIFQEYYTANDIPLMESIIHKLKATFTDKSKHEEKKGVFGSKVVWVCGFCTKVNELESNYCVGDNCGKDKYGFFKTETPLLEIISTLQDEIEYLKTKFTKNN